MYTIVHSTAYKWVSGEAHSEGRSIPVRLPDKTIETIDALVQEGFYANRSAAIRIIVTRYVLEEAEKTERG